MPEPGPVMDKKKTKAKMTVLALRLKECLPYLKNPLSAEMHIFWGVFQKCYDDILSQ